MLYIAEHTTLIPRSMDQERYRNILSHQWRMPRGFLLAFANNKINDGPKDYLDLFEQFIDYPSDPEDTLISSANSEDPVHGDQKPSVEQKGLDPPEQIRSEDVTYFKTLSSWNPVVRRHPLWPLPTERGGTGPTRFDFRAHFQKLEKRFLESKEERAKLEPDYRIKLEELERETWVPKGRELHPLTALETSASVCGFPDDSACEVM